MFSLVRSVSVRVELLLEVSEQMLRIKDHGGAAEVIDFRNVWYLFTMSGLYSHVPC